MRRFRAVGIRELKNQLSACIREVKAGGRILVTEHSLVVAELRQPGQELLGIPGNPLIADWIARGELRPELSPKKPIQKTGVRLAKRMTSSDLLNEERGP